MFGVCIFPNTRQLFEAHKSLGPGERITWSLFGARSVPDVFMRRWVYLYIVGLDICFVEGRSS